MKKDMEYCATLEIVSFMNFEVWLPVSDGFCIYSLADLHQQLGGSTGLSAEVLCKWWGSLRDTTN